MLINTFIHIPGVGVKTEKNLWSEGILNWDDVLKINSVKGIPQKKLNLIKEEILLSKDKLAKYDAEYFAQSLKNKKMEKELWRIFPEFRDKTAFIDIETTGKDIETTDTGAFDYITTIVLYSNSVLKHYVLEENLDDFKHDISNYRVLVTFYGRRFDIPFIERRLFRKNWLSRIKHFFTTPGRELSDQQIPDSILNYPNIDLCYALRNLGYRGSQKKMEKELGIARGNLEGINGSFAPEFWKEYKKNKEKNKKALDTLIAYNMADTLNLEKLLIIAYNKKIEDTPFKVKNLIPEPNQPIIPFKVDNDVINKVRKLLANRPMTPF